MSMDPGDASSPPRASADSLHSSANGNGMQDVKEIFMAVRMMSWKTSNDEPSNSTHREEAMRRMMAVRGVDLKELYDVDAVPEEQAERLSFDVMQNEWISECVGVKVARRMFSSGSRYGCIRMRDTDHGRIKVLKVCFEDQTEERMWEMVKTQALAEICCAIFQSKCPSSVQASAFPPRFIYRLLQRDGHPAILVDELLAEGYNFEKRGLTIHASSQNLEDVMESHKWAAFQYCSYLQADKSMVFERCTSIDGKWVGPVIHSIDRSFGGSDDRGAPAIDRWVEEFSQKYAHLLDIRTQDLFTLTGEQMIDAMSRRGLLPARGTAPLSLLSSPLSSPNSGHSVGLSMASPVLSNGSATSGICAATSSPTGVVSPYPGSPQNGSQVAVHVRSSSNSDHSDAIRLSIRSSGPNSEASDPVPDEYPDDYAISPPLSEEGDDAAKHMARLANTLNQKFDVPSETPWLSPAMPQSLKTTRPIALDEACVASTPVAVTINVNVNVSAILKNASEIPTTVIKRTACLSDPGPNLASHDTIQEHMTATPLPSDSSPPSTQASSSTAIDGASLHRNSDSVSTPHASSDVLDDGCVPLSVLRPRKGEQPRGSDVATKKDLTLVTEGLQRFPEVWAPRADTCSNNEQKKVDFAASHSVSMTRETGQSSRRASSPNCAPLPQTSALCAAGYGAPVENFEADQLHQLAQRRPLPMPPPVNQTSSPVFDSAESLLQRPLSGYPPDIRQDIAPNVPRSWSLVSGLNSGGEASVESNSHLESDRDSRSGAAPLGWG